MGETLVDCIRLTPVGLGDPPGKPVGIALDDIQRAIGGSAIDDEVFQVGIILRQHRLDGLFEETSLVIRWSEDGNERLLES